MYDILSQYNIKTKLFADDVFQAMHLHISRTFEVLAQYDLIYTTHQFENKNIVLQNKFTIQYNNNPSTPEARSLDKSLSRCTTSKALLKSK